jgi:hypothetical protein
MTNFLYDSARNMFLTGALSWTGDTMNISLVKNTYTASQSTHTITGDIGSSFSTYSTITLASKTATAGVADAADVTFVAGTAGEVITGAIIWKTGATPGACNLVAYIDIATGLPLTTNGANIDFIFDNGTNKIFKL